MGPVSSKKRKVENDRRGKSERPKKRFRKQKEYHSSSENEDEQDEEEEEQGFAPVNLEDSDDEVKPVTKSKVPKKEKTKPIILQKDSDEETEEEGDGPSDDDGAEGPLSGVNRKAISKRNDPEAFSTSISRILSTKLSQSARKDPVLSRSKEAADASTSLANERLEKKAKAKLRSDKKEELERGRVKDVLGLTSGQAGEVAEEEKRLRKIAQRGVVKLFNAVRAAQVKAEQAAKEERKKGTIGMAHREEKVNEMSKQGFLDLIGGKKKSSTPV